MKTFTQFLKEAKGMSIEIQVKGVRDLKKLENSIEDDNLEGILISYFDVMEEFETKFSGNKMLMEFDEETMEDYESSIEIEFNKVKKFCKDYTKFAKQTSKNLQKGDSSSNNPVDLYYEMAVEQGMADPKKPFVYTAKIR